MKIKFRGLAEDGKYIFSNSIDFDTNGYGREFCRLKDEFGNWIYVKLKSIAQFVGHDCENKEVYEGDKLVDSKGNEFIAELWSMGANALDADALENGIFKFKLEF